MYIYTYILLHDEYKDEWNNSVLYFFETWQRDMVKKQSWVGKLISVSNFSFSNLKEMKIEKNEDCAFVLLIDSFI